MNKEMENTSALESVSASLCFISLAIEKKTCSTFRLVFALCNTQHSIISVYLKDLLKQLQAVEFTHRFKKLDPVLICQCLALGGGHSLEKLRTR